SLSAGVSLGSPGAESQTTRKPTNGPSESHHWLLGICGSLAFQPGIFGERELILRASTPSRYEPPLVTGCPSAPVTHSATLPSMSYRPQALGFLVATGWGFASESASYQA